MKSQLTLVAAVFFGAMGGSFLTRVIEPAQATNVQTLERKFDNHCHRYHYRDAGGRTHTAQTSKPWSKQFDCR